MKSNKKKRILAAVLCMVMVLTSNISVLAGEEIFIDNPAVVAEEPVAETEYPAEGEFSDGDFTDMITPETEISEPVDETVMEEEAEVSSTPVPVPETEPTPEEELILDLSDGTDTADIVEEQIFSEETELKQEFVDAEGNVIQRVTAKLPAGAFAAETSSVTMEASYLDTDSVNYIKTMMNECIPEGSQLGTHVFFNIQFKVNGEKAESLQPITITIEGSNLVITDTKKANVFYFDPADAAVEGDKDELHEIPQRGEVLENLQAAGESTENIEDYDLSEITFREDGTTDKIIFEGRKSTIYGCYVEEETVPVLTGDETDTTESEKMDKITRYDYKSDEVNVLVTLTDPADLPDNAELVVSPVIISEEAENQIEEDAIKEKKAIKNIVAYDIKFLVDGKEIQPGATVNVQVSIPEIQSGQEAAVYHVDEEDVVENMDGSVDEEGNVSFDTTHFSIYVIVQQGNSEVQVTIEHYDNSKNPAVEIYSKDTLILPVGGKINNYAKATNWNVEKVVEVNTDGTEKDVSTEKEIKVSSDKIFKVYYQPKETTKQGAVSFYDYTVKAGCYNSVYYSINMPDNYGDKANEENKLSVGTNQRYNYLPYRYSAKGKNGRGEEVDANLWLGKYATDPDDMVKGLVQGLDPDGNVVFNYPEPGFFADSDLSFMDPDNNLHYLRKVYKDYKLEFDHKGDTYTLLNVYDKNSKLVATAGRDFFPMNSVKPKYPGYGDDENMQHGKDDNLYFGMRYDVNFKIGDYIGTLDYSFTGDDDLWVILDGKQVVIDLGGIHSATTDSVDLWRYILNEGQQISELTTAQKEQEHTLTILYMERGGNQSNCNMSFTLPSAQISEVTKVPMADLTITKVNKDGHPLEGAKFSLSDEDGNIIATATSTSEGIVQFSKLRVGNYTLREDIAPTGYIPSPDPWTVSVKSEDGETAVATMYSSDGTEYTKKIGNIYQIFNVTKQDWIDSVMDYNKTATVKNWDQRTYDITITASSKNTSTTSIQNAQIKDVIDPRFIILDDSGNPITEDHPNIKTGVMLKNGGTVSYACGENGIIYQQIVWENQTISNQGNQWKNTFTVKAKEEYIGGNNITTNVSPDSSIIIDKDKKAVLPQPRVNVKADVLVKDKEVTIYYGDKVPAKPEILKQLFDLAQPSGWITQLDNSNKIVTYTMGTDGNPIRDTDFSLNWYEDAECTIPITPEAMAEVSPEPTEKNYYLKVSYNALEKVNEHDPCTLNTNGHIASGDAHNENDQKYGVYTVHIIPGEIQIIKTLDKVSDKDEIFKFTVNKVEGETETSVAKVEIIVKKGETTASYSSTDGTSNSLKGLQRGTYVVKEEYSDNFDLQKVKIAEDTNCYSNLETATATFLLGNDKNNSNVISSDYTYSNNGGVLGVVSFTNKKVMRNWQIVKCSTTNDTLMLEGAEFKLTPKNENKERKTYIGISDTNGVVKWYETDETGNKTDKEVRIFAEDSYELSETKAPVGYQLSEEKWTVCFSDKGYLVSVEGAGTDNLKIESGTGKTVYKYYFKNKPLYDLPSAGGSGIFGYMIGGTLLMMAATLILYKMRNKGGLKS